LRVSFGIRVRELRLRLGLSQEDLAERADLHRNYVGGIERGERNVGLINVGKLADALGVSVADLFATFIQKPTRHRS
jgi:transcriptional regulator with XRE-family HTH domain